MHDTRVRQLAGTMQRRFTPMSRRIQRSTLDLVQVTYRWQVVASSGAKERSGAVRIARFESTEASHAAKSPATFSWGSRWHS